MASLQPPDLRSRGRSKSPSGRTRERSTSRQPYRESSSTGERRERLRSRSRVHGSHSRHRSRSRYDVPSEDSDNASDWYRRGVRRQQQPGSYDHYRPPLPPRRDRYYHSDEEDEEEPASYHLNPPRFANESEESDSSDESVDERLAYGDLPGERKSRLDGYKFWSSSPRVSDSQLHGGGGGGGGPGAHTGGHGKPTAEEPGQHPSYARLNPFKYANPLNYLQSSHTGHSPTTTTTPASPSNWAPVPECEMPGFVPPSSQAEGHSMPGAFPPPDASHAYPYVPQGGRPVSVPASAAYNPASYATVHHRTSSGETNVMPAYANPAPFQYAQLDPNIRYSSKNSTKPFNYSTTPQYSHHSRHHSSSSGGTKPSTSSADVKHSAKHHYPQGGSGSGSHDPRYVEITPGSRRHGRSHSHSGNNLSVAKPDPSFRPASPMQEPYRGTYQSISPMPSPIAIPTRVEDDISDAELEPHKSDEGRLKSHRRKKSKDDRLEHKESRHEGSSHKRERSRIRHDRHHSSQSLEPDNVVLISPGASQQQKRVSFYDPTPDARAMQEALSHTRHIDYKTLTRILPHLDSEDMLDLRKEYKHHVKLHGKGINMAKHLRLKLGNTSFGKACYATALGRWESEAHWANCYYQSGSSRRELLIESLMGRPNSEIRAIKECFRDSRYLDSLEKCMKAELKADKFRTAVLLALDERRQSEREPLDRELVEQDVYDLHRALVSPDGGETAMVYIIVRRSDAHLREVLRKYEKGYRQNFAKAMIAKSQNLVVRSLFIPFLSIWKLIEYREKHSPTSSTAPSTAPCATPSSFTKPYANPAPAKNDPNFSSRA